MTKKPHGLTGRPSNNKGKRSKADYVELFLRVPEGLKRGLKEEAEERGKTMNAVAIGRLTADRGQ